MRRMRIRTNWAGASILDNGRIVVCLRHNGATRCYCFASAEALRQAMDTGLLSVHRWALAIPKDLCIVKHVRLPTQDFAEATAMVEFEIGSLVPLPRDAISYGSTLLGQSEHLSSVLVWILRREILDRHLEPYKAMGIEPKAVIPDVAAAHHWFTSTASLHPGSTVYVLAGDTRVLVLTDVEGRLQTAHEMSLSHHDSDATIQDVSIEILRLHQERAPGSQDNPIILAGEERSVARIQEQLHRLAQDRSLEIAMHIVPSPPMADLPAGGDIVPSGEGSCYQAVVVAGLAELFTASVPRHMNLLPCEYLQRHERRAAMFRRGQQVGLCILLVLLSWACLAAANWRLAQRARLIESQIAPIRQTAGTVDSKRQRLKAIQRQLTDRDLMSRTVQELYECTPQQISFCELKLSYSQGGLFLDLRGQADMLSTAFEYTEAVREAKLVRGIQIVNAQQVPQPRGGNVVDFRANCSIRGN